MPTPGPSLTELFPAPETLRLGEREVVASPLRLRDLLELERHLATLQPSPWEVLAAGGDPSAPIPRKRLREAHKLALSWPPRFGSPEARELLGTVAGAASFLSVCCRLTPGLTVDDAAEMAAELTAAEWAMVGRVAWGTRPAEAIRRMVEGGDGDDDPKAEPVDWGAIIEHLAHERHLPYEAVLDLPLVQIGHMLRRGEPPTDDAGTPGGLVAVLRRQTARAAWYDPDEELPAYVRAAIDDLAFYEIHGLEALKSRIAERDAAKTGGGEEPCRP